MGKSQATKERIRKVSEIELETRSMTDLIDARPNIRVNLKQLENVKIPRTVLQRGMNLKAQGRARESRLYPWKFIVSGDDHETGTTLYSVNIADLDCSCMWFVNTGSPCKHLVAALLTFVEAHPAESSQL